MQKLQEAGALDHLCSPDGVHISVNTMDALTVGNAGNSVLDYCLELLIIFKHRDLEFRRLFSPPLSFLLR